MWEFLKQNFFLIFLALCLIWLGNLILTQLRYKKKGVYVEGTIVGYVNQSGNAFPVFEFEYNGEKLRVDSYNAEKNPLPEGEREMIYYLPGNNKGVFTEKNVGIKLWQILGGLACLVLIVARLVTYFMK